MPRKRRTTIDALKPKLTFEESPVNIVHGQVSPVFCSDFPAKADIVPVEQFPYPWVTSQFPNPPSIPDHKEKTKKSKKNRTEEQIKEVNRMPSHSTQAKGFAPLSFIRSKKSPQTDIVELSCDENSCECIETTDDCDGEDSLPKTVACDTPVNSTRCLDEKYCERNIANQHRRNALRSSHHGENSSMNMTAVRHLEKRFEKKRLFSNPSLQSFTLTPKGCHATGDSSQCERFTHCDVFSSLMDLTREVETTPKQNILVPDTPEEHQGLPVRLRRKMNLSI